MNQTEQPSGEMGFQNLHARESISEIERKIGPPADRPAGVFFNLRATKGEVCRKLRQINHERRETMKNIIGGGRCLSNRPPGPTSPGLCTCGGSGFHSHVGRT